MNPMTHDDAIKELAVEQYLLDELMGESRGRFEAHLFDCTACTADIKAGLLFLETAKQQMRTEAPAEPSRAPRSNDPSALRGGWFRRLFQPLVLAPALAAALVVIVYQSAVLLPHVQTQLALAQTPSVVETLTLANAGPRGSNELPEVLTPANGVYALSIDLPPAPGASTYRLTLYNSAGNSVWHVDITALQDKDSVELQVPAAATGPGTNTLVVQALQASAAPADLASYKYTLRLQPETR